MPRAMPFHSDAIRPAPLSRRAAIARLGGTLGAVGLSTLLADPPIAQAASATPRTHFPPRAKRVIHLFMNGGPFQADFFDPKPALTKYAGQRPQEVDLRTERATAGLLPAPWKYEPRGRSGLLMSELLPHLAECADDLCVLRSVHSDNPNHGPALYQMNNGTITPKRPSMGSWFLYGLGPRMRTSPAMSSSVPGGRSDSPNSGAVPFCRRSFKEPTSTIRNSIPSGWCRS